MSLTMKTVLQALICLGALLTISCNKATQAPATNGQDVVKSEKTGALVYPHDAEFFKSHGTQYLQEKGQCLSCHGADGSGGNTKVSCQQCHQNFPHPADWSKKELHATAFQKSGSSCAGCHGDDWKGGKTQVSCQQCHNGYPHPKGWTTPSVHGKAFVEAKDKAACFNCHDSKKLEKTATDCTTCHVGFPHMKGHKTLAMTYDGKCTACHRNLTENMPKYGSQGGCTSCHDGTLEIHWLEEPEPTPTPKPPAPPTHPNPPTPPGPPTTPGNVQKKAVDSNRLPSSLKKTKKPAVKKTDEKK